MGLETLRRLMSVQLEQCIDLESYHTSDVQWHYFGDAPTACGAEASSDPAVAEPPPAVQGTTDADEQGRDSCVCCRLAMSSATNQAGGREIDVPKVMRCLSRRTSGSGGFGIPPPVLQCAVRRGQAAAENSDQDGLP